MISINGKQFIQKTAIDTAEASRMTSSRGYRSYASFRDIGVTGYDQQGEAHNVRIEQMWGELDPLTKLQIYQKCPPVFAVVSGRANRISSLEFSIMPFKKIEDQIAYELKCKRDHFNDIDATNFYAFGQRAKLFAEMSKMLPHLRPDLSNFDRELYQWSKRIKGEVADKCNEIKDFFMQPSRGVQWSEFIKQCTVDLLVHGRLAIYKQQLKGVLGSRLGGIIPLPGGSVYPVKGEYVGEFLGYVQMVDGFKEPQLFHTDEVCFMQYLPNSGVANGLSPIDSLLNLVSENLLFSEMMARYADGSKPPEKAVVFGEPANGFGFGDTGGYTDPIDKGEQRRIENKLNRIKREAGVAILTGIGTPMVLDLTRADTLASQMQRQEQIDRSVAMVYNSSNMEINQTGGDGTSGRSTSETQERAENQKAIRSTIVIFEEKFTHEIIPQAFGYGYYMQFSSPRSDEEKVNLAKLKKDSGLFSTNEIRVEDFNRDPYGPEYDLPQAAAPQQQQTDALMSIANKL